MRFETSMKDIKKLFAVSIINEYEERGLKIQSIQFYEPENKFIVYVFSVGNYGIIFCSFARFEAIKEQENRFGITSEEIERTVKRLCEDAIKKNEDYIIEKVQEKRN